VFADLLLHQQLDLERKGRQVTEEALRSQVSESEWRKEDALAALKEASEKSDGFKRDCEEYFHVFSSLFACWFSNLYFLYE
jgi:hypothetical protein